MINNIMKIASMCACAVVVSAFAVSVRAEGICTKKIAELERQLSIAKQHKNTGRAAGLERALENVRTWCTEDGELAEAKIKVLEKQEKVAERQAELDKATAQGVAHKKIEKRQQKLREAQDELKEAEKVRDTMQQDAKK